MENTQSQIPFPQIFYLKVIFDTAIPEIQREIDMAEVFDKHMVPFSDITVKNSSKGAFISYSIKVELVSHDQMQNMYADLKKISGVKVAM